jgi:hypothetical protein
MGHFFIVLALKACFGNLRADVGCFPDDSLEDHEFPDVVAVDTNPADVNRVRQVPYPDVGLSQTHVDG